MPMSGVRRCPTSREDAEIRCFLVPTGGEPEIMLQVYRRAGHDLAAPLGPTTSVLRLPVRYAEHLAELIVQLASEAAISPRQSLEQEH